MNCENKNRLAIFTIISNNYFHFAKTLFQSLEKHHSDADFYAIIVDEKNDLITAENFNIVNISELDIPNLKHFLFRYNILEANTAVKPWSFDYLFNKKNYTSVIYLDPDIYVYKRLDEVIKHQSKLAVITPHITEQILDDKNPSEFTFLQCGIYNLGFIALNQHKSLTKFLDWWKSKLEYLCIKNIKEGLFVDQKWIDLITSLFDDVIILKDKRYNTAYWNIFQREEYIDDIVFLHFSGVKHENLSIHQNRINYSDLDIKIRSIYEKYLEKIKDNDNNFSIIEYKYNFFHNGKKISDDIRKLFNLTSFSNEINPFLEDGLFNSHNILNNTDIKYFGFYDNEQPLLNQYVWTSKTLGVKIPEGSGILCIKGLHDESYVRDLNIKIIFDNNFIKSEKIHDGYFEINLDIPYSDKIRILDIICDKSFIPMSLGINQDCRELSTRIGYIALNDVKVLDFSKKEYYNKPKPYKNIGINSIGYAYAETGVGQVLRYFSNCMKNNINNIIHPIVDKKSENQDLSCSVIKNNNFTYDFNIFFMNGDEQIWTKFDFEIFKKKYNIGYWAWELEDAPNHWFNNECILDEIWTGSNFNLNAFSQQSKIPCVKISPPIEFNIPEQKSEFYVKDKFNILMIYDKNSVADRKNPLGTIKAFMLGLSNYQDTVLLIKTNDESLNEFAIKNKIIIINKILSREEIYKLQNSADCYISLHRSEGFGLNIAESMFLGKPTIATNWSGNTDYMNEDNSFLINYELKPINKSTNIYGSGKRWAEPDLDHAAYNMKKVYRLKENEKKRISFNARKTMIENYSNYITIENIRKRLGRLIH